MALQMSATMHGVMLDVSDSDSIKLGPAIYTEVEFEGCQTRALIYTGSPVTIVSVECALAALAERRRQDQSPSEWELSVKQRLKPPDITLRSYGGEQLDIVGQLSATIQRGKYCKTAVV